MFARWRVVTLALVCSAVVGAGASRLRLWFPGGLDITAPSPNPPERDPRVLQIQGSTDGVNFTPVFVQNNTGAGLWTDRSQVLEFDAGIDFAVPSQSYSTYRFIVTATGLTTGARFQLNEIEYFDNIPEPTTTLMGLTALGLIAARRRRAS